MRLSRSRVLLRVALLGLGGAFVAFRGVEGLRAPAGSVAARLALVQLLVAGVALVAALGAAASLRRRRREPTFRLRPEPPAAAPAPTEREEVRMLEQLPPGIVDGPTAARLAAGGAVVVDVRSPAEFAAGHVPGALNVPFDEVARRAAEIGPPTTPVVVYCKSGHRSGIAREQLRRLGFEKVWDVQRYEAWPRR